MHKHARCERENTHHRLQEEPGSPSFLLILEQAGVSTSPLLRAAWAFLACVLGRRISFLSSDWAVGRQVVVVSERVHACVHASVPQAGWLGLAGSYSGCSSSLEVFVDGFYIDGTCFGVSFANSSLPCMWIMLLRQYARNRDPPWAPGECKLPTKVRMNTQAG